MCIKLPTLALSKSGYRVEGVPFLSACQHKLPRFSIVNKKREASDPMPPKILFTQVPTAALSASGIRVEGVSFLSACLYKLPFAILFFHIILQYFPNCKKNPHSEECGFWRLSKNEISFPRRSSGECVQGVKTPCAFNKTGFSNFFESLKNRTAGRKCFFDTLKSAPIWVRI